MTAAIENKAPATSGQLATFRLDGDHKGVEVEHVHAEVVALLGPVGEPVRDDRREPALAGAADDDRELDHGGSSLGCVAPTLGAGGSGGIRHVTGHLTDSTGR